MEGMLKQQLNATDFSSKGWFSSGSNLNLEVETLNKKLTLAEEREKKYLGSIESLATTLVDLDIQDSAKKFQVEQALISAGVKKYSPSIGEICDPSRHHVVCQFPDQKKSPGIIAHVFQEGYMLRDRVFYPAHVAVTRDIPIGPRRKRATSKA